MLLSLALWAVLDGVALPKDRPLDVAGHVKVAPGAYERAPLGADGRGGVIVIEKQKHVVLDLTGVELRGVPKGTDLDRSAGWGVVVKDCEDVTITGGVLGGYKGCVVATNTKGLVLDGVRFDGFYGKRLLSTVQAEDGSDWRALFTFEELRRLGYDPAKGGQGDSAGCAVLAPPAVPGGKFRVLERHRWQGMDFDAQARAIRTMCDRYNVAYIGIDTTGIGEGVYQLVKQFYPAAHSIQYNPSVKIQMVMKAQDVMNKGRLEFDSGWTDLAQAFMSIRRAVTAGGKLPTFEASRSEETSHADIAWATMQALLHEPLAGATGANTSMMEIFA